MKTDSLAARFIAASAGAATAAPAAPVGANRANIASPAGSPTRAPRKPVTAIKAGDAAAVRTCMAVDSSNDPAYADNWAAILTCQGA